MRLEFAATLLSLTIFYSLVLVLFGAGLLDERRQRRLGYGAAGLGFLILYPLVTVLVVVIAPSWVFAIVGLATVALWARHARRLRRRVIPLLVLAVGNALAVAAVAALFWLPGLLRPTVGLFSEAGGDFTIYAGVPAKLGDRPLWTISSKEVGPILLKDFKVENFAGVGVVLSQKTFPPSPGWSMQRLVELDWGGRNPGWYSLQDVFFRGSWGPLEWQYLAILAVLWAVVVRSLQRLIHLRYGKRAGRLALLTLVLSHGLIAVGFNHYLPQLLATTLVATTTFVLALPEADAFPRRVRVYFALLCAVFIGVAYYPMLPAAVVPFTLLVGMWRTGSRGAPATSRGWVRAARWGLGAVVGLYLAVSAFFLYEAQKSDLSLMVSRFLFHGKAQAVARDFLALGHPRPINLAWFDALLGGLSLQMLPPFATTDPTKSLVAFPLALGGAMLVGACVFMLVQGGLRARAASRASSTGVGRAQSDERRFRLSFAVGAATFLLADIVLGRRYEYTQFKGLAYALPFTLLALVITAVWLARSERIRVRVYGVIAVVLLVGSLGCFQIDAYARVRHVQDRTAVLDQNLPNVAAKVRQRDPHAYLLAFPEHPSEYSLWEFGLRNSRALILRFFIYPEPTQTYIRSADVSHLWVVDDGPDARQRPGGVKEGDVAAYPAAQSACSVRAAVLQAAAPSLVMFTPFEGATPLWRETNTEYWIFGLRKKNRVQVLVKEHPALHGRTITAKILYPKPRTLSLRVAKRQGRDAVAIVPKGELPLSGLVVLQLPGTGYSDVLCN